MNIRYVEKDTIINTVKDLCIKANTVLRPDVLKAIEDLYNSEKKDSPAKDMLKVLLDNAGIARDEKLPICQDTGLVAVFMDIGGEVVVKDDDIEGAVNKGVEDAYREGHFRKSVVADPILRDNTGTNTPAVLHVKPVKGDKIKITVMPKGFGAENKSRMVKMNPTSTPDDIVDFCVGVVKEAGPDACPPYVLGIGIGGTMEECAYLAKKALTRSIDRPNPKPHIADLEKKIKQKANALGIGVMGLGGSSTIIGVNIEEGPTHIAGLPVAVNICCHALRSASAEI